MVDDNTSSGPLWRRLRTGRPGTGWTDDDLATIAERITQVLRRDDVPAEIRVGLLLDLTAAAAAKLDTGVTGGERR